MYFDDDRGAGNGCVRGALILAAAMLAVVGIFVFGINRAADTANPFNDGRNLNPLAARPTTISIDRPAIIRQIQALNRLETSSTSIEKVIEAGQSGGALYNLLVGDQMLLIAHGQVIAGFDLTKLRDEDVILSPDGATATLTLPPAEILVSRLDNTKTRVYSRQQGVLSKGNIDLESEARRVAEQEILRAACEDGILTRAATEGENDIAGLLGKLGFKQITVNATAGQCLMPDGTPLPPLEPTQSPG